MVNAHKVNMLMEITFAKTVILLLVQNVILLLLIARYVLQENSLHLQILAGIAQIPNLVILMAQFVKIVQTIATNV